MATTIKLKNGSGAPLAGDLVQGEPALDLTNKRLYTENASGTVIEVGTNPSTLTVDTTTLVVDAGNNRVGINTASPAQALDVVGTIQGDSTFLLSNATTSSFLQVSTNILQFGTSSSDPVAFYANNAERMRIDASGNVGIGTTSPTTALTVSTDGTEQLTINRADASINTGNTVGTVLFTGDDPSANQTGARIQVIAAQNWTTNAYGSHITFSNDNSGTITERMRIDSSGNVGIGTTSPSNMLHLSSSDPTIRLQDTDATGYCLINAASNSRIQIKADEGNNDANTTIEFHVDGSERMRIDSSGNVGIGTTSPDSKLQITTGTNNIIQHRDATHSTLTNVTSAITFSRTDGIDDLSAIMGWNDGGVALSGREGIAFATGGGVGYSSTVERMRIDTAGKVGVGITNPSGSFHVTTKDASGSDVYYVAQNTTSNRVAGYRVLDESGAASLQMQYDNGGNAASIINPNNGALSIYLGGTAAANALDDYEEGVHTTSVTAGSGTPSISSTENKVSYTAVGDSVSISGQLGSINCSGCSGALNVTMPFTTKTNTDRSDFYFFICASTISTIEYFYLSQTGGGSSTFLVIAKKSDGSVDSNVATLLASHGVFDLNIIGGTYKKS